MENGNRPHSRQKTVGVGSANVGKGRQVNTGSRPVGMGGRNTGSSGKRGINLPLGTQQSGGTQVGLPTGKLNLKTILLLVVLVIVGIMIFKACSGGISMPSVYPGDDYSYPSYSYPSYSSSPYSYPSYSSAVTSQSYVDPSSSDLAREKYYTPLGNGQDTVTIMVYMCGTDLESKYGMATKDLNEMLNAQISNQVNIIVETGGCSKWKNNMVSSSCNQIYKIERQNMIPLEENFGTASMTDPNNLTNFVRYCKQNYEADRYILIFWDHGGGTISGYGYDEKNPSTSSMTLSKINSALKNADCKFDFIGFDACLMATLETDLVCNNYADYMIGSEETEPGTGWYYTNWLTMLSQNTSTPTVYLGQKIVDDFVSSCCSSSPNAQVTLSVVDLSELDGTVPDALRDFAISTNELVTSDSYQRISDARAGVRQFSAKSKLNQIDLIDLATRIDTPESNALAKALTSCVKYNKSTISRSNGISMYFPYENTKTVKNAVASYNDIGNDADYTECMDEYTKCIQAFASLEYGGQIAASASQSNVISTLPDYSSLLGSLVSSSSTQSASTSPLGALSGMFTQGTTSAPAAGFGMDMSSIISLLSNFSGRSMPMPDEYNWVDTDLIADNASQIAQQFIDPARLAATEKNGKKVLELTDEEWKMIQTAELNVFVDDGDGYIDLGLDNVFEWMDDNSMLLEYDGTWLTLDGNVCAYYLVSDTQQEDGSWVTVGRVPALLNGELVNLQVVNGEVTGAYPMYEGDDILVQAKGDIEIADGDTIEFLCDYYDFNGDYSASYSLGNPFKISSDRTLVNLQINTQNVSVAYRLTDIYGNHFWVPVE